jgi:hypothetical protein
MSFAGLAQAGRGGNGKKTFGTVYVKTQGLYFDTFAAADALPHEGPFQDIYIDANGIGQTDFGPGDKNYVGGRWQVVDPVTHLPTGTYFLCPLLGPGRTSP